MTTNEFVLLAIGLVGGGAITWLVQHLYSLGQSRLLERIDSRGRAEFIEERDPSARAAEREDGSYAVDYSRHLRGRVTGTAILSAKLIRGDGRIEELGEL